MRYYFSIKQFSSNDFSLLYVQQYAGKRSYLVFVIFATKYHL